MQQLARIFGTDGRLKLLRLFLFNQDQAFSLLTIIERAKLTPAIARREVNDLVKSGLLRKKKVKGETRFQVNARYAHLEALDRFIRDTTAIQPQRMVSNLRKAGNVRLLALTGHFTGILEPQVDLLIVGDDLDDRVLSQTVRAFEAELGREIRYASFPTGDFRYRMGVYDRLLRDVFDYPHRILVDKIGL